MDEQNYVFQAGEDVEFNTFESTFRGKILGPLNGQPGKFYYVLSHKGEVRIYEGKALSRR
jgi:hypothetical protein